jgi:hypothetical protein
VDKVANVCRFSWVCQKSFPTLACQPGFSRASRQTSPWSRLPLLLSHFQGAIDGLAGSSDEEVSPAWPIPFAEPDIALKEPATARW